MLKNIFFHTGLLLLLLIGAVIDAASQGNEFNKAIPELARQALKRADKLAEQEKFVEALAECKKAIAKAPKFVQAHVKYINLKSYFLEKPDEVKAEYETLTAKNPANPVYPAALAIGLSAEPKATKNKWLEAVVKLAPDSVWGHYAKAQLIQEQEPEKALAEYYKAIEKDSSIPYPYSQAILIQDSKLRKIDDAIATAEKMAREPDLKTAAMSNLWRLRLKKAETSEEAKAKLRAELSQLVQSSNDVAALAAARSAYQNLLKDKEAATRVEEKIKRIDVDWYPERGTILTSTAYGNSGPSQFTYAGRQLSIYNKLREIGYDLEAQEQMIRLEQLLALNPNSRLKENIYDRLLNSALIAKNDAAAVGYGEKLLTLDSQNSSVLVTVAMALANQKRELEKALGYARRAEELTREFRPVKDIPGMKGNRLLENFYSEAAQEKKYKSQRARALDAYGWLLFQTGKFAESEAKLREAIQLGRSEDKLAHLSHVLRALNRIEEADRFAEEAKNEYTAALLSHFKNDPIKDFELATIDGRKIKLSDLKGKVVMVNFWATWCKPCIAEMPLFVKAYDKYKERGFEILAITVDALKDRPKVVSFAQERKINFPILYDESVAALYGVHSYPTSLFIGKQGTIRYQNSGLDIQNAERDLGIVIEELLKDN